MMELGILGIIAVVFLIILSILWLCLPFALFGVKPRLDAILKELQAIRSELKPYPKIEPK